MDKVVGDQPPPLAARGEWRSIGPPANEFLVVAAADVYAGEQHADEDRDIDAEKDLREADGGGHPSGPGHRHHDLFCVFRFLTTLRRLVLYAPLADLFPEGKSWEVAAASSAICHGLKQNKSEKWV